MKSGLLATTALCALCLLGGTAARAQSLSVEYFEIPHNSTSQPDFGGSGVPDIALGSTLGPDGLPVVNTVTPGVSMWDQDASSASYGELEWWSPTLSGGIVSETSVGTINVSQLNNFNMYAPNSTGSNDSSLFETAVLSGEFSLTSMENITFNIGSDDDGFVFLDGVLVDELPGIHGGGSASDTVDDVAPGEHDLEIFYADRESSGANLTFSFDGSIDPGPLSTTTVPEPGSFALLASGLGLLGGVPALRRRRKK